VTGHFRICASLFFCVAALSFAQQSQSPLSTPLSTPSDVKPDPTQGMIRLDVVVTDKNGNPVTGLRQQDFTLHDNGQPGKIVSWQAFDAVTARPDPPVEVILVIDELNLPAALVAAANDEAQKFLQQNHGHLAQPVSIYRITKDGLSALAQPPLNGNLLADEIAQHRQPPFTIWQAQTVSGSIGRLAKDGALHSKLQSLVALGSIAIEERRRPGRKLMFWLSPGWHFENAVGIGAFDFLTELLTRLREARIELWKATEWPYFSANGQPTQLSDVIFPEDLTDLTSEKVSLINLALYVVATQTGGGVLSTRNNLGALIGKRVEQDSKFYSLTFDPPPTNKVDEYHDLKVEVSEPNLTVRTSIGYYDQPVFYDQPRSGIERMTVAQLEQALQTMHANSDAEVARRLSGIELTERLSTARLPTLQALLKGKKSQRLLIALADESVFLALPAEEIPSIAPPEAATQRQMISRTVDYVNKTIPKLPNFLATRTTVQYHQPPLEPGETWKTAVGDQSLRPVETSKAPVHFLNGKEVVGGEATGGKPQKPGILDTVGTFGPILATVLVGATSPNSVLTWSHWEHGVNGPQAVFVYRIPQETPRFFVGFGYLAHDEVVPFKEKVPFHGELGVDPASGAILRLTVQADLEPRLPLDRSGVMVEYTPVVIGEKTYICPARSVSISRQRRIMDIDEWGETLKVDAPFETLLDDMAFDKYHIFRSTARMLPGYTPAPGGK
jgi:VWFA-related protein